MRQLKYLKYNKEHFHIEHGVTIGLALGLFANEAGLR